MSEREAYEDVLSTMAMDKAQRFFARYPHGAYRDRLADALIGSCDRADDACGRRLLATIPRDHRTYGELHKRYAGTAERRP